MCIHAVSARDILSSSIISHYVYVILFCFTHSTSSVTRSNKITQRSLSFNIFRAVVGLLLLFIIIKTDHNVYTYICVFMDITNLLNFLYLFCIYHDVSTTPGECTQRIFPFNTTTAEKKQTN